MAAIPTNERLAKLEVEVLQLIKNQGETEAHIISMNAKLDDLLALRYKGVGAFWLASSLVGTGLISVFLTFVDWIRHG